MSACRVEPIAPPLSVAMATLLGELHARCFSGVTGADWSAQAIRTIIEATGARAWLSYATNHPAGLLLARAAGDDGEILTFGVLPEMRRTGHGRALMRAAATWAQAAALDRLVLEVAAANAPAQAFYRRCGFVEAGRRPAYYGTSTGREDALVMTVLVASALNETCSFATHSGKIDE